MARLLPYVQSVTHGSAGLDLLLAGVAQDIERFDELTQTALPALLALQLLQSEVQLGVYL